MEKIQHYNIVIIFTIFHEYSGIFKENLGAFLFVMKILFCGFQSIWIDIDHTYLHAFLS